MSNYKYCTFIFSSYFRDCGERIRECVKLAFNSEKGFTGDPEYCKAQYDALKRLTDNHYGNLYKRKLTHTSTGLTPQECNIVLSNESLQFLEEENKSFFKKYFKFKTSKE